MSDEELTALLDDTGRLARIEAKLERDRGAARPVRGVHRPGHRQPGEAAGQDHRRPGVTVRASTIMLAAAVLYLVHRWSTGGKTLDPKTAVEVAFAVFVIALLDQGQTEPVAKGFAWLFFAGAAYAALPTIGKVTSAPAKGKKA